MVIVSFTKFIKTREINANSLYASSIKSRKEDILEFGNE